MLNPCAALTRRSSLRLLAVLATLSGTGAAYPSAVDGGAQKNSTRSADGKGQNSKGPTSKHTKRKKPPVGPVRPVKPLPPIAGAEQRHGAGAEQRHSRTPGGGSVALGAYVFNCPGRPDGIDRYAEEIGRMPAIVMWYTQWGGWDNGRLRLQDVQEVAARGAVPLITWDPWNPYAGFHQPEYRLVNIARGAFDGYIDSWAKQLAGYGQRVYLRFGHEMNGDWYPWCAGVNGNTAADYVAAWRRIYRRFAKANASNVRFVWSPNVQYAGSTPLAQLYPGSAYVDWVGLDGYNWGTSHPSGQWLDLKDLFMSTYQQVLSITSKPMMIAETASTELGGDKAAWIRRAFLDQLPALFPNVRAVIWFNENKETDWRVSSSPETLAAIREAASHPYLQGRLR